MRTLTLASGLALVLASSFAVAQTANDQKANPPTGNDDSDQAKTSHINSQDHTTGNDLAAKKTNGMGSTDSSPQATGTINGQNSATGNNLSGNAKGVHGTVAFDTLDTGHKGMLSRDQAMKDPWLAKNFANCDTNKDGMVSGPEYAICTH
jgi:hypothetical protein